METAWMERYDALLRRQGTPGATDHPPTDVLLDLLAEARTVIHALSQRSRHAEMELAHTREYQHIIFDSAPDACYLNDTHGRFVDCNRAAEEMTGYARHELLGASFLELALLSPQQLPIVQARLAAHLNGERVAPAELTLNRKDGRHITIEISTRPVYRDGELLVLGIARDLAERKQIERERELALEKMEDVFRGIVDVLVAISEWRDPYTAGHQRRVASLTEAITREMGIAEGEVTRLSMAALLHDIGKFAVPIEILCKPGKLNEIEMKIVQTHAQIGYELLTGVDFPWPIAEIVLQHHERLDGSGYPRRIAGEEITPAARIIAVADVVEVMSSHRPYRPAIGLAQALDEIQTLAGVKYDREVVEACLRVFRNPDFDFK